MKKFAARTAQALIFSTLGIMLFSTSAFAYIDPATTSYILQIIAGVFITCGVVLGIFWTKVRTFFRNLKIKMMEKKLAKKAEKK